MNMNNKLQPLNLTVKSSVTRSKLNLMLVSSDLSLRRFETFTVIQTRFQLTNLKIGFLSDGSFNSDNQAIFRMMISAYIRASVFQNQQQFQSHQESITENRRMSKQVVLIMEEHYPFGQCEQFSSEQTGVSVRQKVRTSPASIQRMAQKATYLRYLSSEYLIKIESLMEEEENLYLIYEYVPIRLETWISNINSQFIDNFKQQLIKFSYFLAENDIVIDFQFSNVGMDQNYNAKYFVGLDYDVNPTINRDKLKSVYIRDISHMFRPYVSSQDLEEVSSEMETFRASIHHTQISQVPDSHSTMDNLRSTAPQMTKREEMLEKQKRQLRIRREQYDLEVANKILEHQKGKDSKGCPLARVMREDMQKVNQPRQATEAQARKPEQQQQAQTQSLNVMAEHQKRVEIQRKEAAGKQSLKTSRLLKITEQLKEIKTVMKVKENVNVPQQDTQNFTEGLSNIAPQSDLDFDDNILKQFMEVLEEPYSDDQAEQNSYPGIQPIFRKKIGLENNQEIVWSAGTQDDLQTRINKALFKSHKVIDRFRSITTND